MADDLTFHIAGDLDSVSVSREPYDTLYERVWDAFNGRGLDNVTKVVMSYDTRCHLLMRRMMDAWVPSDRPDTGPSETFMGRPVEVGADHGVGGTAGFIFRRDRKPSIRVAIDPVDTFDVRVRQAVGTVWSKIESVALSFDAADRLEREGLISSNESPGMYAGKYLYLTNDPILVESDS